MVFRKILTLISFLNRIFLLDRNLYLVHHGEVTNIKMIYDRIGGSVFISQRNMNVCDWKTIFDEKDITYIVGLLPKIKFYFSLVFSQRIFLNDSCVGLHFISFSKKQKLVQLWHACGAFKRFGLESLHNTKRKKLNAKMYSKYSLVTVSSEYTREAYAKSFSLPISKVLSTGVARTDLFFDENNKSKIVNNIYEKFPEWKEKHILMYAPTFRDHEIDGGTYIDLKKLKSNLSENWIIIVKQHPFDETKLTYTDGIFNANSENINQLMYVTDLLVSDYSSLIFEFSIFNKPMVFYAHDLEEYENEVRGFYYKYDQFVPGPICKTEAELYERIKKNSFDLEQIKDFKQKYMGSCDGRATDRILAEVFK